MFDLTAQKVLLADVPGLITLYWSCAIVGGGLLLFSLIGGLHAHGDLQVDAGAAPDLHGDLPTDAHVEAPSTDGLHGHAGPDTAHHADSAALHPSGLTTWFSIRFLVFFVATFGAVGVVLTHLTETGRGATFAAALLGGLVVGQAVHQTFRKLRQSSGDSTPEVEDYLNQVGRVTVAVVPPNVGEIAISVRGGERYVPAVSRRADTTFQIGEEVAVVAYQGGVVEVVPRKEFEFLRDSH
jgi:membrane protein implicated in regulation of membrane protease activity